MGLGLNAGEVLEMAEAVERNGAAFYRKAAEQHADELDRGFLLSLAQMEDEHEKTFSAMRADLSAGEAVSATFDPDNEAAMYLAALADGHGGEGAPSVADALTGKESLADILTTAIELEKKSILFYVGLKELVPEALGKNKVEAIIREETQHVAVLRGKLVSS